MAADISMTTRLHSVLYVLNMQNVFVYLLSVTLCRGCQMLGSSL